jgi:hypothetical protein
MLKKVCILEQDIENRKNKEYAEELEKNRKLMKIMLNNIKIVQDLVSKNEIKTTYNDATNSAEITAQFDKNERLLNGQYTKDVADAVMANATGAQIKSIKEGFSSYQECKRSSR